MHSDKAFRPGPVPAPASDRPRTVVVGGALRRDKAARSQPPSTPVPEPHVPDSRAGRRREADLAGRRREESARPFLRVFDPTGTKHVAPIHGQPAGRRTGGSDAVQVQGEELTRGGRRARRRCSDGIVRG
jgi:hypothetical protein